MKTFNRCHLMIVGLIFATLAAIIGTSPPAFAAGLWYVATIGNDGADCLSPETACATINGALNKSGFVSGDSIRVAVGTYNGIGTEVILIEKDVSLSGGWDSSFTTQSGTSTIDGEGVRRGVTVLGSVTVVIDRFTIQNGFDTGGGGGGISNDSGILTVTNSTITHNISPYPEGGAFGGGIFNGSAGVLTVINSAITSNTGDFGGGGIYNRGAATITDSTIDGNIAGKDGFSGGDGGGGIEQFNGISLTIDNSTISNNNLLGFFSGSGIEALGTVTLNNSTVSGNTGGAFGEGIYSFVGAVDLSNSTITNNQNYGIFNQAGAFTLKNTIIANNGSSDCFNNPSYSGTINSSGYNLVENNGNCTLSNTDLTNVDPKLGPLQNNGGPTFTHALLEGSPAIDTGSPDCPPPATDQRGVTRPQGPACDIGAFETGALAKTGRINNALPKIGLPGSKVTIVGRGFTGATAVTFNATPATFTVLSNFVIRATVPVGATTGPVSVTTPSGTISSAFNFTVPPPVLTRFAPSHGAVGKTVTIIGKYFTGATSVTFNGTPATFTVSSNSVIHATIPAGASTGPISVTTPYGTAISATNFAIP